MQLTEASEEEEQAIDRLLSELGIHLPAVEACADGEDILEPVYPLEPDQPPGLGDFREWPLSFS